MRLIKPIPQEYSNDLLKNLDKRLKEMEELFQEDLKLMKGKYFNYRENLMEYLFLTFPNGICYPSLRYSDIPEWLQNVIWNCYDEAQNDIFLTMEQKKK